MNETLALKPSGTFTRLHKPGEGRKHILFDRPYLQILIVSYILWGVGYVVAGFFSSGLQMIPAINSELSITIGVMLMAIIFVSINKLYFKGQVPVTIGVHGLGKALALGFPIYAVIVWNAMGTEGTALTPSAILIAMIEGAEPGILEEMAFRAITLAHGMKGIKKDFEILLIAALSTLTFSGVHLLSLLNNNFDLGSSASLVISCLGTGMLYAAIYLRTGNILATIIFHTVFDAAGFLAIGDGVGIMRIGGVNVTVLLITVILIAYSLFLLRKSKRIEIMNFWNERFAGAMSQTHPE